MEKKLRKLIKESMIEKKENGSSLAYQTYKNILEKAQKAAKENKVELLTDTYIYDAVKKEVKQLEDTLSYCKPGDAYYQNIAMSIEIAKTLLPVQVTSEEMLQYLQDNQIEKNMGACMKILKTQYGASFDGKIASEIVKQYISQ